MYVHHAYVTPEMKRLLPSMAALGGGTNVDKYEDWNPSDPVASGSDTTAWHAGRASWHSVSEKHQADLYPIHPKMYKSQKAIAPCKYH